MLEFAKKCVLNIWNSLKNVSKWIFHCSYGREETERLIATDESKSHDGTVIIDIPGGAVISKPTPTDPVGHVINAKNIHVMHKPLFEIVFNELFKTELDKQLKWLSGWKLEYVPSDMKQSIVDIPNELLEGFQNENGNGSKLTDIDYETLSYLKDGVLVNLRGKFGHFNEDIEHMSKMILSNDICELLRKEYIEKEPKAIQTVLGNRKEIISNSIEEQLSRVLRESLINEQGTIISSEHLGQYEKDQERELSKILQNEHVKKQIKQVENNIRDEVNRHIVEYLLTDMKPILQQELKVVKKRECRLILLREIQNQLQNNMNGKLKEDIDEGGFFPQSCSEYGDTWKGKKHGLTILNDNGKYIGFCTYIEGKKQDRFSVSNRIYGDDVTVTGNMMNDSLSDYFMTCALYTIEKINNVYSIKLNELYN